MHLPLLKFRKPFHDGYKDIFVRNIMALQHEHHPDIFNKYPEYVRQDILSEKKSLKKNRDENNIQNMMKEKKTAELLEILSKKGIDEVVCLKGIYLLKTLYKNFPGIRGMGDTDLLLKCKDFKNSRKILEKVAEVRPWNFRRPLYSRIYHEYSVHYKKDLFEIHRGQTALNLFKIDYDSFFSKAKQKTGIYGENYLIPPLEMMIVFFIIHDISAGLACYDYRHAAEMHIMLSKADKEKLSALCEKFGISRLLDFTLFFQSILFQSEEHFQYNPSLFHAFVSEGEKTPFSFTGGDIFFKICIFRKEFLKKTLPAVLTSVPDLLIRHFKNQIL